MKSFECGPRGCLQAEQVQKTWRAFLCNSMERKVAINSDKNNNNTHTHTDMWTEANAAVAATVETADAKLRAAEAKVGSMEQDALSKCAKCHLRPANARNGGIRR